jgi:hypothetical protein
MAKKVSMKLPKPKKDNDHKNVEAIEEPYYEKYPYGLEIRLDNKSLGKLGMSVGKHKVGQKMTIEADTVIESTNAHQRRDGELDQSMSLQITDLAVEGQEQPQKSLFNQFKAGPGKVDKM